MINLITIGDLVVDTHVEIDNASLEYKKDGKPNKLCLDYAGKIPIKDSFQSIGGNAGNVAVGVNFFGIQTHIISTIGTDANGQIIFSELNKHKINTELIKRDKKITTRYSIILNFKGERTILSYHSKINYTWPKKIPKTNWIYYTSLSEGHKKIQIKMLDYIKKNKNIKLVFNPGSYQLKYNLAEVRRIVQKTDILIINTEEAEMILKTKLGTDKEISNAIHNFLFLGAKEIVLTNSDKGAYAGNSTGIWKINKFSVKVISKTGAGDAFSSGYISAKILENPIEEALRWGVANGANVITKHGAQNGLLNKKSLNKLFKKYPKIKAKKLE